MNGLEFSNQIALPLEMIMRSLPGKKLTSDEIRRGNLSQIMTECLLQFYALEDIKEFTSQISLLDDVPAIELAAKYPNIAREAFAEFKRMIDLKRVKE